MGSSITLRLALTALLIKAPPLKAFSAHVALLRRPVLAQFGLIALG